MFLLFVLGIGVATSSYGKRWMSTSILPNQPAAHRARAAALRPGSNVSCAGAAYRIGAV